MRNILTLLLAASLSSAVAQAGKTLLLLPNNSSASITDTAIAPLRIQPKNKQVPNTGIPNAIILKPAPPVFKGNNGQGFDVYDSRTDNMPMLVPDSSFGSNMPNAFQSTDKQKSMILPNTFDVSRFKELLDRQKQVDTISIQPWQFKNYRVPKK